MTTVIITLSNKPDYLPEAVASVERQTRTDYLHVVGYDTPGRDWGGLYPPGVWYNRCATAAGPDDYVCWLSDDDLLLPHYVATLAGALDEHPEWGAVYGGSEQWGLWQGQTWKTRDFPANRVYDAACLPSCQIDGGQMLVRRSVLAQLAAPWHPVALQNCHISDGLLMNRVAMLTPLMPVGVQVMVNRKVDQSCHWRATDLGKLGPGRGARRD